MRNLLCASLFAAVALAAAPAQAQFANRSLGLSVGYMDLNDVALIDSGVPIGIEVSVYIESGFDFTFQTLLMILNEPIRNRQVVGFSPSPGIRYLFMEEDVRPYIGLDLSYLHIFGAPAAADFVGLGPKAGLDLFVGDSVSLGARVQYNLYLALNTPLQTSASAHLVAATYF